MITEEHLQELEALIKAATENESLLNDFERDWVSEWEDKVVTYQTALKLSTKQQQVFDRIAEKLKKHGVYNEAT